MRMSSVFSIRMNRDFVESVIGCDSFLDNAVSWVGSNVDVADAYSERDIVDYVKNSNLGPDDLFDDEDLSYWAEANGYVKFFG